MESLIVFALPFVVSGVVWIVKRVGTLNWLKGALRRPFLRFLVVAFSFGGVWAGALVVGADVDPSSIEMLSEGLLVFLGASGVHFFAKKKSPQPSQ